MASKSRWRRIAGRISGNGPVWMKALRWLIVLSVVGFVAGVLFLWILYRSVDIPDENADFLTQTTTVYYSDGKHVIGKLATQDRESIPLSDVPESMQAAVIAAEDRTFWDNRGIDLRGIARALRDNTSSGEITAGGSTITQQYVKLLYLTQERTYTRKLKEAALALKVHNKLSKDEILEGYLNTVYYGNGAYGVEVAARTYFAKPAKELTVQESAALATIINIPSYYDPYVEGGTERLLPRYNYVIDGMAAAGDLSAADAAKFRDNLPKFSAHEVNNRYGGPTGFLLKQVEQEMNELQFSDATINGGGFKIVTTFDYEMQKAAQDEIRAQGPNPWPDDLHRALVSIEPGRGAVRAMYGGPDFLESQINWATVGTQPGSTFKVFALAAALDEGFSLKTRLNGASPMNVNGTPVENQGDSGGQGYGIINLTKATESSVNTAYLDIERQIGDGSFERGAEKVLTMAKKLGVSSTWIDRYQPVPVATLGYEQVSPIDMANAYATIVAGGKKADWYVVESVTSREGAEIHKHEVEIEQVIPEKVAGDALVAMKAVVQRGTGRPASTVCSTVGKTGTATAGVGQSQHVSSSWFIGSTPKLTTAVMQNVGKTGNGDVEAVLPGAYFGGRYPAQTFRAFMNRAVDSGDCGTFPAAGNIRGTKGQTLAPSTAALKCPDGYELRGTKCHALPRSNAECQAQNPNTILQDGKCVPIQCPTGEQVGPDGLCHSTDPTPTEPTATTPDYGSLTPRWRCIGASPPGVWDPNTLTCSAPPG